MTRNKLYWALLGIFCAIGLIGGIRKTHAQTMPSCDIGYIAVMQRALDIPKSDAQKFLYEIAKRDYTPKDGFMSEVVREHADGWLGHAYEKSVSDAGKMINASRWESCNTWLSKWNVPGLAAPFRAMVIPVLASNDQRVKK